MAYSCSHFRLADRQSYNCKAMLADMQPNAALLAEPQQNNKRRTKLGCHTSISPVTILLLCVHPLSPTPLILLGRGQQSQQHTQQSIIYATQLVLLRSRPTRLYDADDWTWVTARRQRKKKKVLAGFARATGDRALTASIHDVVVLPELQGLGLGRKLLAKATNQVTNLVVTVLLVTVFLVVSTQDFSCTCSFLLCSCMGCVVALGFPATAIACALASGKPDACHAIHLYATNALIPFHITHVVYV